MESKFVIRLSLCNRCGEYAYEKLASHSHCVNCNYSPNADEDNWEDVAAIPLWALEAIGEITPSNRLNVINREPGLIPELEPSPVST